MPSKRINRLEDKEKYNEKINLYTVDGGSRSDHFGDGTNR